MEIRDFLTARLDEDEAAAHAAAAADPAPWTVDATDGRGTQERDAEHGFGLVVAADDVALWDCEGSALLCMTASTARHVGRWDPARVLREVEAKRTLLADLADNVRYWASDDHTHAAAETALETAQRHLAAPYADHPDYDPAWKLDG
jgi:hypothetical protein